MSPTHCGAIPAHVVILSPTVRKVISGNGWSKLIPKSEELKFLVGFFIFPALENCILH